MQIGVATCASVMVTTIDAVENIPASTAQVEKATPATPVVSVPITRISDNLHPAASSGVKPISHINPNQEKDVDWVTRIIAIVGVILGVANFCLTYWKIRRDRRLSVEDDFWFRKIIAPVSIEPLIKSVLSLLHEMPDADSPDATKKSYAVKITSEFQKLYVSMQPLALIDESWPRIGFERLQICEDILTNRIANPDGKVPIELQSEVLKELNQILRKIKDGHLKR